MKAPRLLFTGIGITILTPACWCQVTQPTSVPENLNHESCPSYPGAFMSAAGPRCKWEAEYLLDGGNHWFSRIGALGGYDSAFESRKGLATSFKGGVLDAGLVQLKSKSFNLFENSASGLQYLTTRNNFQYLDSTTVSLTNLLSARTASIFNVNNVFGNNEVRILQLSGTEASAETPSYGIHNGRIEENQADWQMFRQSTETRWWSVSVRNTYRDFINDNQYLNTVHGRAEVQFQPSSRTGIGLFEQTSFETGSTSCTSQSVGMIYEHRFTEKIAAEGAAAPSIGSKGCLIKYSAVLYGSLAAQPRPRTNLWISGSRDLNDSEVAYLTYENNARGGLIQYLNQKTSLKVQGGWIGGTVVQHRPAFNGEYVASTFARELGGGFTTAISFQHFNWSGISNISPNRTIFTAGIYWSSNQMEPNKLRQVTTQ